ncbi:MAG: NapC/NirT family cytochrome c, partial [Planctomycetota bacterium]
MFVINRAVLTVWIRRGLVTGAILGVVAVAGAVAAIEYTARPSFCITCHIMKPYYDSWEESSHKHVPCVDCHFEPGLLETLEGKFKASTHVAKYFTGTEGTKPWAEVSDRSCMRSGCHSWRLLRGRIPFKRVYFDHRHHLLEMRRGKRLRCTTCHSQIVQGDHINVTESVCFICHFLSAGGTEPIADCDTCHGPPKDNIAVGEVHFLHSTYIQRGVSCED